MADKTKIEWTDATWNPITGCSVMSPGCTNCYAMRLAGTRLKHIPSRVGLTRESKAGPVWNGTVLFNEPALLQPLKWRRPRMIFVCAHGDLFAENVPDTWIDQVFAVMALAPQHTFQVLTKRPERMREYTTRMQEEHLKRLPLAFEPGKFRLSRHELIARLGNTTPDHRWLYKASLPLWPLPNVWLGVSVEDQKRADERIPVLLDTPATVRFISAEPLLGPIDVTRLDVGLGFGANALAYASPMSPGRGIGRLDWVIAGGESGPGARPMHPDWARSLRDQCAAAGVPFFFKQWGAWKPVPWKLERQPDETDQQYIERSEGECSQHAISKAGYLHEMSHRPWSCERVLPHPDTHHAVKLVGKARAGRLLDGVEHNAMPIGRPGEAEPSNDGRRPSGAPPAAKPQSGDSVRA